MLYYNLKVPTQFIGTLSGERTLQRNLTILADDNDKYVIGFSGDVLPTTYFVVPGTNETWANGLDDKKCVSECLALFETEQVAQERMNDFVNNSSLFWSSSIRHIYCGLFKLNWRTITI